MFPRQKAVAAVAVAVGLAAAVAVAVVAVAVGLAAEVPCIRFFAPKVNRWSANRKTNYTAYIRLRLETGMTPVEGCAH